MRVKLITLRFAPSLGGFDDRPLAEFVRDKEVLAVREHFFAVHDLPHVACLVTYQDPKLNDSSSSAQSRTARPRRKRPDPTADLDETERILFGTLREWRAARARKDGVPPYVILTNRELVTEALALERELRDGSWRPRPFSTFEVHDPKTRTITAVPFRDQVVHHALMAQLAPLLERRMIADSYACRRGKGTHAALRRAHGFVRRFGFFLKLDVRSFFASVRHDVVMDAVERVTKDRDALALGRTILAGPPHRPSSGVGLPIGALTSQWFANAVLDRLDHVIKEDLRIPGYVRYMDDMVLFSDERSRLRGARGAVERYLTDPLRLALKGRATMLAPTTEGLPFLGWLLFRGTVRLRPANLRRSLWRLRLRRWEMGHGLRDEASYRQGVASVFALLCHGNTTQLRRRLCESHRLDLWYEYRARRHRPPRRASSAAGNNTVGNARAANRNRNTPENRNTNIGFRPASPSHRQIAAVCRPRAGDRDAVHVTDRLPVLAVRQRAAEQRGARRGS